MLGLLVNAIVHWNTRYMGIALDTLLESGIYPNEEDVKHLSPILWEHINIVGRYSFVMPKEIADGRLRKLIALSKL